MGSVSRRVLAVSLSAGLVWGCAAVVLILAMFRGLVPAPVELIFPLNIAMFIGVLPFQVSVLVEGLAARSTYGIGELVFGTVGAGVALGAAIGWSAKAIRRPVVASGG
jgi:hypothetical protein